MKALTCEMCGSTNLIKEGGVFVCQSCGTKYSLEEAKKMMVEGTVDVKGTVKLDNTDELKNLYEIARRAKETNNSENACKYYDMILVKDPQSWEANFFVIYYKAMSCKIAEISLAAQRIQNAIPSVLDLVKKIENEEEQKEAIKEIYVRCAIIADMLHGAAINHYEGIDVQIKNKYTQECVNNCIAAVDILNILGGEIESKFGEKYGLYAAQCWEKAIVLHNKVMKYIEVESKESNRQFMIKQADRAKKYDPNYVMPTIDMKDHGPGCVQIAIVIIVVLLAAAGIIIPIFM